MSQDRIARQVAASGYSAPGFAERYDSFRPRPPAALKELLPPLAGVRRPALVVDLGSGSGLSTRFWADLADQVVGVEPNREMVRYAERVTSFANVRYLNAAAEETGLPDRVADIVTAAQSLQWMDRERVFTEITRLLRPGGVFCAYEYFSLQTPLWTPEAVWARVRRTTGRLRKELGLDAELSCWQTGREPIENSGAFREVRELALHSIELGDGQRLLGFALSEGSLQTLLAAGVTEEQVGLDELLRAAAEMREPVAWWIGYRVWLGLR